MVVARVEVVKPAAPPMFIFSKRIKGSFGGDLREKEGIVLGTVCLLAGATLLFLLTRTFGVTLPEWGARTVAAVAQTTMFVVKTLFFCWVFIWVRWSLPRFRYDQLMRLGWKNMIPLAFANIVLTGLVILALGG